MNARLPLFVLFLLVSIAPIHAMDDFQYVDVHDPFVDTITVAPWSYRGDITVADPQIIRNHDWTELHRACLVGDRKKVTLLLSKKGVQINQKDSDGKTPLHRAAFIGDVQIIRQLLQHGAFTGQPDNAGKIPLHIAVAQGHETATRLLLANGAFIDRQDNNGKTPLHVAVSCRHSSIVRLLLEYHALTTVKDKNNMTPYDCCCCWDNQEIAHLLLHWQAKQARLAFCEALHPRLGEQSPARVLPQPVIQDILGCLHPRDFIKHH